MDYLDKMTQSEKNRIVADNFVQSTLHFNKRLEKIFALMKGDFFDANTNVYHVSSYYYRIEFQQRGAPHCHALLWLKDKTGREAPNYWINFEKLQDENISEAEEERISEAEEERILDIEKFTDQLISTSPNDIRCNLHDFETDAKDKCSECTR